jgi:hypothetical protein
MVTGISGTPNGTELATVPTPNDTFPRSHRNRSANGDGHIGLEI